MSYDQFWQGLIERQGRSAGTGAMIELLQLGRRHGQERLRVAVETAPALGCRDAAAVRHLLATPRLAQPPPEALELGTLERFDRPPPTMDAYDQLLAGVAR